MRSDAAKIGHQMKGRSMKTRKQIVRAVRTQMKFIVRQLVVLIAVLDGEELNAAAASDLKTFTSGESYVVEGVPIVLTQKLGEATVKVGPAVNDPAALTAANGAKFDRDRELPGGLGFYRLQSTGALSEATAKEAIDSLNQDSNTEYAYPVYVNAATGKRHFLSAEVVARLHGPLASGQTDLLSPFKLAVIDTLSARDNIYVFRLKEPKNFNPFQV